MADLPEWVLYADVPPPPLQGDGAGRNLDRGRRQPTFTLLGGRIGSGRSWFTSPSGPLDRSRAIFLDVIEIAAQLGDPKYFPEGVDTSSWPTYEGWNVMQFYAEAHHVFLQEEATARLQMVNIIVKSTMRVKEEAEAWVRLYKQAGYWTCGYYMYASPIVAADRALLRSARGEKAPYFNADYILRSTTNEATFDAIMPMLDTWAVYDNMGSAPTLVAKNSPE